MTDGSDSQSQPEGAWPVRPRTKLDSFVPTLCSLVLSLDRDLQPGTRDRVGTDLLLLCARARHTDPPPLTRPPFRAHLPDSGIATPRRLLEEIKFRNVGGSERVREREKERSFWLSARWGARGLLSARAADVIGQVSVVRVRVWMEARRGPGASCSSCSSSCGLPLLLLPLLLLSCCGGEEEVLLNTKLETSDLGWTNHPAEDPQWEELSGVDEEATSVRTYEICTPDSPASYWLRTRWIPRRAASVVYVEIRFTMMECASLNRRHCKETFDLYSYQSDHDEATPTHPAWMETPYAKVSTLAAEQLMSRSERRSNLRLLRLPRLRGAGLYLAFRSQGACMALLAVRVFYRKCPPLRRAFAHFPETVPHSLVEQAQGVCVENAVTPPGEQSQPPSMLCGEDGQWVGQPTSSCSCRPGYEAGETNVRCRALGVECSPLEERRSVKLAVSPQLLPDTKKKKKKKEEEMKKNKKEEELEEEKEKKKKKKKKKKKEEEKKKKELEEEKKKNKKEEK
ncbi:Ephrin type-B receptor 4 [Liparis tanakae]|uniref:Ephrin type-B receptor 4 n=1 Tax=Liparis tanakae TaxID=230148 RepID=A0A4Z2FR39_9TELE|nr:Ephrin type-B receptor 4 [Liparis tanakae]